MAKICPTVTAFDAKNYKVQIERIKPFAERVHIDLMDGIFAPTKSPGLDQVWWPHEFVVDLHLMYQKPMEHLVQIVKMQPHMVIIHNEAEVHHMHFAGELHKHEIKVGLAILQDTPIEYAYQIMHSFDQVLIFSGKLGHHGGIADLTQLDIVKKVKQHHPDAEIAWDGGINDENAREIANAGVDILNTGGYIQNAEDPQIAYAKLNAVIKE